MSTRTPKRAYHSERRASQAAATRRAVIAAGIELFITRGFARTTIADIARDAGVAPETVYAVFGSKRAVLAAAVDVTIAGDDEARPLAERAWVHELGSEPARSRRIELLAREGSAILQRRTPLERVLREAATGDPEINELLERGRADRHAGQRRLIILVLGGDAQVDGEQLDAMADAVFAVGSPEVYELLTGVRGWSHARFATWYADMLQMLLVAEAG